MQHHLWSIVGVTLVLACGGDNPRSQPVSESPSDEEVLTEETEPTVDLEIVPGVSIGPVQLGATYASLEAVHGPPDDVTDYNRIFFATWDAIGVEVVMGSGLDDAIEPESIVVSVGTALPLAFSGVVVPGMTRSEADELLGTCPDVVDDKHCYHPVGVYLGYDRDGVIDTVAVHPAFELRSEPPAMLPALGLGGMP